MTLAYSGPYIPVHQESDPSYSMLSIVKLVSYIYIYMCVTVCICYRLVVNGDKL